MHLYGLILNQIPLQQGLKHELMSIKSIESDILNQIPLQQGLKQVENRIL